MKRPSTLLVALVLAFSTLACTRSIIPQEPSGNAAAPDAPKPVEKTLSSFTPITGTDYLMGGIVPVEITRDSSINPFEWISRSGYSGYSYFTYNYVFFNTQNAEYHRLLPDNNSIILQTAGFPQQVYDPNDPTKPAPTIEFWMYNIIKADTNGDANFDYLDKLTVGISDVGGGNYTELIENVDFIQSQYYKDASNFFVIYNVNEKNFIAKVNPITREVLSTTEMDLGEDVK